MLSDQMVVLIMNGSWLTLLAANASVDARDEDGRASLMLAAGGNNDAAARALIAAGAAVEERSPEGLTARDLAMTAGAHPDLRAPPSEPSLAAQHRHLSRQPEFWVLMVAGFAVALVTMRATAGHLDAASSPGEERLAPGAGVAAPASRGAILIAARRRAGGHWRLLARGFRLAEVVANAAAPMQLMLRVGPETSHRLTIT